MPSNSANPISNSSPPNPPTRTAREEVRWRKARWRMILGGSKPPLLSRVTSRGESGTHNGENLSRHTFSRFALRSAKPRAKSRLHAGRDADARAGDWGEYHHLQRDRQHAAEAYRASGA